MKISYYEAPRVRLLNVTPTKCLMASNGENLNKSVYGSRGNTDDDTDDFWG